MVGWINLAQRTAILSPQDLRTVIGADAADVTVRGILRETPQRRVRYEKTREIKTSSAQLEVSAIRLTDQPWQPACGRIAASVTDWLPDKFFGGQTVEISGVIKPPRGPVAEGLFDYPTYLKHLGIYYQVPTYDTNAWKIISSPAQPPLADRFCNWARKTIANGLPVEDESLQLEWALTLGWKAALTEEVSEPF